MKLTLTKRVQATNLKLAEVQPAGGHPNKIPFTCSLFSTDKPSEGSPYGADGKLIRISSAVCDQYLSTFEGMGINIDYQDGLSNHDVRFKVGVISKTFRSLDGYAMAEGYIYGKDFPDVIATIRYYNGLSLEYDWPEYKFGTSIEMEAKVTAAPDDPNVLDIIEFCGTGAAILFAEAAAYKHTSFAARNHKEGEEEMKPEELKALQDSIKSLGEGMTTMTASLQTIAAEVGTLKTDLATVKAAKTTTTEKTAEETAAAELKAAEDRADKAEKDLAALKASSAEPQRKTLSAAQTLAKYGTANAEGIIDHATFCASIDQLKLSPTESIKLKMKARAELGAKESV
jgi:hypothetical protein